MKIVIFILILISSFILNGCDKFLDAKSDMLLSIPERLEDNQALLDHSNMYSNTASSGEFSSDDLLLSETEFDALVHEESRRLYTWKPSFVSVSSDFGNDWYHCYNAISVANTVIFNLEKYVIDHADHVKGQAHALRAFRYLDAAQIWCPAYDSLTAHQVLGLPLRLDPDISSVSKRNTLKETYDQIISDLKIAISVLPSEGSSVVRFSKPAVLGLLSRTYLYMGKYLEAQNSAELALSINSTLMDFNTLNATSGYPIQNQGPEVLYRASMRSLDFPREPSPVRELYESYEENDLRKSIFFNSSTDGEVFFKGSYNGSRFLSTGIAIDEIYLTLAESLARNNKVIESMRVLEKLLVKRWKTGTFSMQTVNTQEEALEFILSERRKELVFRGMRWADIKRLNRDGLFIRPTRTLNGVTITLQPNDSRYAIAIPEEIISLTGMQQNQRE